MVRRGLRSGKQERPWAELVGYGLEELMAHLERQFLPGMAWSNIGGWHVDHIIPLAAFSFETPQDEEFKAAWALTNLRPLWAEQNRAKWHHRVLLI